MNTSSTSDQQDFSWFQVFTRSLRGRLVILFIIVGLLPLGMVGAIGYWQAATRLRVQAGVRLGELAFHTCDKVDRNLFERYGDVQAFAKSDQAISMDPKRINSWMNTMIVTYTPIYTLMVVADTRGKIVAVNSIDSNGQPIGSDVLLNVDVSNQEWFKIAISGQLPDGKSFVDDLHEDGLVARVFGGGSKAQTMSFSYPIRDAQGKIVGAWSNRFNWQALKDILSTALQRLNQTGTSSIKFHLVNKTGLVLYSENANEILSQNLGNAAVVQKALAQGAGGYDEGKGFEPTAQEKMIGYFHSAGFSTYPGLNWSLLTSQDKSEALTEVETIRWNSILVGLISALVIVAVAVPLTNSIVRPIHRVVNQLRALSTGGADLTLRLPETSQDELGDLARAFNTYMDSLVAIMRNLIDSSTRLSSGTTQIAAASNEMAAGAESQTQQVIRTSSAMEEMSASIKEVARNAQATASATSAAVELAQQGSSKVQAAMVDLDQANLSLQDVYRRSTEIDQVVKLIADIAAQTNILALNAAIEAAGAGAAGTRFDVVAEEIRKLAGRTAESTARVGATVDQIQLGMQAAADRMNKMVKQAQEVEQALTDIVECIASVNDMVSSISTSTTQQARAAEQVADALQMITQVSRQTAIATRETNLTIDDLSGLSQSMSSTASQFKV